MEEPDIQLLKRYVEGRGRDHFDAGADEAFAELVRRQAGLVYSAALRQVRSPELAEEVTQSVFVDLARNASRLAANTVLSAWLYQVARHSAIDVVRQEHRRQVREQLASEISTMNTNSAESLNWDEIEPLLDEAMEELEAEDRTAILLRYFEKKSLREVGSALGTSENAAQKRLSRAIERLNQYFTSRGVRVGASGLVAAISANAVQAVPAGLVANICAATADVAFSTAAAGAAVVSNSAGAAGTGGTIFSAETITTVTTMTTIQKSLVALSLAAAVGTGVYHTQSAAKLREEMGALRAKAAAGGNQDLVKALNAEHERAAALQAEIERLQGNNLELLRLRDEVTRLRQAQASVAKQTRDDGDAPIEEAARDWLSRVNTLKQRLVVMPQARIPEMELLTEEDWLSAAKSTELETEEDFRRAFASLRNSGQNRFAKLAQPALSNYLKSNGFNFPTDVSQLLTHMEQPINPAILERYAILPESTVPNVKMGGDWAITQKAPVDQEYDQRFVIGPNGYGSASYPKGEELVTEAEVEALMPVLREFTVMNDGKQPVDPSQLDPFVKTPEQRAALEKVYQSRARKTVKRD